MATETHVSLTSLSGGACVERFDDAMIDVLANIADANTDPEATREIRLTIKIKPIESRAMAAVTISCEKKLAPPRPVGTSMYLGRRNGVFQATEWNPDQPSLLDLEDGLKNLERDRNNGNGDQPPK